MERGFGAGDLLPSTWTSRAVIRVLVVDDHQMFTESLVRLLDEDPEITVVGAETTAAAGIAEAVSSRPDVVVLDFQLPDSDGASTTVALRRQLEDVKVIVVSGSNRPGARRASLEAGADAWIRKTSAAADLVEAVRRTYRGLPVASPDADELPEVSDLVVHYQPVIEFATVKIVGFEALVRWNHPSRGLLRPAEFLPLAEETGFILELSRAVLRQAVGDLTRWQGDFPRRPRLWVSVNVSASCIEHPSFVDWVWEALGSTGLTPSDLVLEITETVLVNETPQTVGNLARLKELGVRLALDDFGTAFSSISYLRQFPFDHLKIDTSFTAELPHHPRAVLLVESILHIADVLGMTAIAEGVERLEQEECLMSAGWSFAQGYHYSPPLDGANIPALIESGIP